jgi:hypothetical protein
MTNSEFRKKLLETANVEWFNSVTENFNLPHIQYNNTLTGFSAIYEFVNQQIEGWQKLGENLPNQFKESKDYFIRFRTSILNLYNSFYAEPNQSNLNSYWQQSKNNNRLQLNQQSFPVFTYSCSQTEFLLRIFYEASDYFEGAYNFIVSNNSLNTNSRNSLIGYILAYEFLIKGNEITQRKNAEKSAISKIRNDFDSYLSKTETDVVKYLSQAKASYEEYVKALDELKTDKESNFNEWFTTSKSGFETFNKDSHQKIKELEITYREKLKLEEPANYWFERAKKLKTQGWWALGVLAFFVILACVGLGILLWQSPESMLVSWFSDDKSAAIRWSIVFITILTFLAYGIRAVNKVMFSSFHLARDCEERHTLTYFYLSLLNDSKVDDKDRQLIMQSLFSRADTGLLKEDSSPTLPGTAGLIERVGFK